MKSRQALNQERKNDLPSLHVSKNVPCVWNCVVSLTKNVDHCIGQWKCEEKLKH